MRQLTGFKYFLSDIEVLRWLSLKYRKVPQIHNNKGQFYRT